MHNTPLINYKTQQAVKQLVQAKSGPEVLIAWPFPNQEAVAICMPDYQAAFVA